MTGRMRQAIPARVYMIILALGFLFSGVPASADSSLVLKNSFIQTFKDRVTIDASYTVDRAHSQPNPPDKDGDLHAAGRAPEIGLPVVAEIMNAADETSAVDLVHQAEASGQPLAVSGAWRIWFEHPAAFQKQGDPLDPFTGTNPDHSFEIHPVTRVGNLDVRRSLKPIEGYETKDAAEAFDVYEGIRCEIVPNADGTTTITSVQKGYNYVEFVLEVNGDQRVVADGRMVMANVLDLSGNLLRRNRRMVFVQDTEPERQLRPLKKGDRMHVVGIPRLDLSLVNWRIQHALDMPECLTWNLPYEIIVVAFYADRDFLLDKTWAPRKASPGKAAAPGTLAAAAEPAFCVAPSSTRCCARGRGWSCRLTLRSRCR